MFALLAFIFIAASFAPGLMQEADLPAWLAPSFGLAGWVFGVLAVKLRTKPVDLAASLLSLPALGYVLDRAAHTTAYFTALLLVTGLVYSTRLVFLQQFGHIKRTWWEPLTLLCAMVAYFTVNLSTEAGWMGWSFPALPLFFASLRSFETMKDKLEYTRAAQKEYSVEEGKAAPPFALPDHGQRIVSLADYRGKQLVLLLFIRGDWCPSCHIMLRTYARHAEKFREKNVLLIAIGPDPVGVNREMVQKLDLEYRVLADEKQEALKAYGIQYQESVPGTGYETGVPMPAAILVDKQGIVRYLSRADRAGEFLNPMKIFTVLERLEA